MPAILSDLYAINSADFREAILPVLKDLMPCDRISYNELDMEQRDGQVITWFPEEQSLRERLFPIFCRYLAEHPTVTHLNRHGDVGAIKFSDFVGQQDWEKTTLWNEYFRPIGTRHQLAVTIHEEGRRTHPLAFHRQPGDFSERDRLALNLLQPHLKRAYDNWLHVSQLQRQLDTLGSVHRALHRGIVEVSPQGVIIWATPGSEEMLLKYSAECGHGTTLTAAVRRWVKDHRCPPWKRLHPTRLRL